MQDCLLGGTVLWNSEIDMKYTFLGGVSVADLGI